MLGLRPRVSLFAVASFVKNRCNHDVFQLNGLRVELEMVWEQARVKSHAQKKVAKPASSRWPR